MLILLAFEEIALFLGRRDVLNFFRIVGDFRTSRRPKIDVTSLECRDILKSHFFRNLEHYDMNETYLCTIAFLLGENVAITSGLS